MAKIEKFVQKFIKSYQKQDGLFWRIAVPDGKGHTIRKQGFFSEADARERAVKEYLNVLAQTKGTTSSFTKLTFEDYSLDWLETKRRDGLGESTAMRYEEHIRLRLIPFFGVLKMVHIEKYHLKNFIKENQLNNSSSALLKHSVSVFKSIIKQAEIDDHIAAKGILSVPTPKHKNKEPVFWDLSQIKYFLSAMKESKHRDLWTLTLFTGMRAGEVAGLKWECVHLDKSFGGYSGLIDVRRMYNQKTKKIQEHLKNKDRRIIPILPEVREILLRLSLSKEGEFVLGGAKHLDTSHFSRTLHSEISKTELPDISFHKLRHSFCSYLESTGMARRMVSHIMGHRDSRTTDRYSHANDQMLGVETKRWLENQILQNSNNLKLVNF